MAKTNLFVAVINLDAIIEGDKGKEAYGAWLRGEISGNELADRLGASVKDTQNGIQGLLTAAKLRTVSAAGKCGAIVQVGDDESLATAANRIAAVF